MKISKAVLLVVCLVIGYAMPAHHHADYTQKTPARDLAQELLVGTSFKMGGAKTTPWNVKDSLRNQVASPAGSDRYANCTKIGG